MFIVQYSLFDSFYNGFSSMYSKITAFCPSDICLSDIIIYETVKPYYGFTVPYVMMSEDRIPK